MTPPAGLCGAAQKQGESSPPAEALESASGFTAENDTSDEAVTPVLTVSREHGDL